MANELVNQQITNSIQAVQQATMTDTVIKHSGAGKAYQSVAQSTAIAVQDATDQLRNMSTIYATATGVAISQLLAGDDKHAPKVLSEVQTLMESSAKNFATIGKNASDILSNFPSGD